MVLMISNEQIARINELYRKQKSQGLSEEEKKEQVYLRRLFIDAVKANLKAQLDSIKKAKKSNCCGHHNHNHNHSHGHNNCGHPHHHGHGCDCDNH